MDNLELIEKHIVACKPLEFIRNCISCAEVDFLDACQNEYINVCRFMIKGGYDVHGKKDYSLRWASNYGHAEIVKELLEAGADVHAGNDSSLRLASYKGNLEVVRELLKAGADVHVEEDYALSYARINGHTEVVKFLEEWIESHG